MKRMHIVLGMTLTIGAATTSLSAYAGWGFRVGFPVFPVGFGLGLGTGFACAYPYYAYGYPAPASYYYCAPPVRYVPEAAYAPPADYVPTAASVVAAPMWVPATSGAGHWVPDLRPYHYSPDTAAKTVTPAGSCG